jgi:hypothetical protein
LSDLFELYINTPEVAAPDCATSSQLSYLLFLHFVRTMILAYWKAAHWNYNANYGLTELKEA